MAFALHAVVPCEEVEKTAPPTLSGRGQMTEKDLREELPPSSPQGLATLCSGTKAFQAESQLLIFEPSTHLIAFDDR